MRKQSWAREKAGQARDEGSAGSGGADRKGDERLVEKSGARVSGRGVHDREAVKPAKGFAKNRGPRPGPSRPGGKGTVQPKKPHR